jgi:hypothetical protein
MRDRRLVTPLFLAGLLAFPLNAQNFGEITGTVTDPTGAVATGTRGAE